MPDTGLFVLFVASASVVALTPGPGIFYVITRSLKGGRDEGLASTFGNSIGGLVHVCAATLGLSAILTASATAFTIVKMAGAAYLVYLGVRTMTDRAGWPRVCTRGHPRALRATPEHFPAGYRRRDLESQDGPLSPRIPTTVCEPAWQCCSPDLAARLPERLVKRSGGLRGCVFRRAAGQEAPRECSLEASAQPHRRLRSHRAGRVRGNNR